MKNCPGREKVLAAFRADPSVSVSELVERTGLSHTTVYHHLVQLDKKGVIVRNTQVGTPTGMKGKKRSAVSKSSGQQSAGSKPEINRGESAFKPKKARGDQALQARIDAVVAKAKGLDTGEALLDHRAGPGEDVIRVVRGKMFKMRVRASKVG